MTADFEFNIIDDGTSDTAVEVTCNRCGHSFELRYNPDGPDDWESWDYTDDGIPIDPGTGEPWDRVEYVLELAESDMDSEGCPLCDDDETMVRCMSIFDVPAWIERDITIGDCVAVQQGGCGSGAYMPAVTYHLANQTMAEYGDNVLDYIEREYGEIPAPDMRNMSWCGLAVYFLSIAVELWCGHVCDWLDR